MNDKFSIEVRSATCAGIDILDVSSGLMSPLTLKGPAMLRNLFREAKKHVKIPVIGTGALDDIDVAAELVAEGEADFIGIGRKIMKQPNFVEGLLDIIQNESR